MTVIYPDDYSDIKVDRSIWKPVPGDKVVITDFDGFPGNEAAKLAKLPYCTVDSVLEIPIGEDGNYHWEYEIYIVESEYLVGTNYKKYEP